MAYVSTADMRAFLEITSTDDDAIIASLLASAQRTVDALTHRTFEAPTATTRQFTPLLTTYGGNIAPDGRTILFDGDLCALTSVVNGDGVTIPSSEYYLVAPNSTVWYGLAIKRQSTYQWTYTNAPELSVSITGKWSYTETCPADIATATKLIVKHLYTSRAMAADADRDVLSADGVIIAASKIPSTVHKILGVYRRYS